MTRHLLILFLLTALPSFAAPPTTAQSKILILPFTPVDARDRDDLIGRGVQQSLVADLARADLQPITVESSNPAGYDSAAALNLARAQSARYVLHGTYQLNNDELRLTGLLVDVDANLPLGSIKITGSPRDLFDLEDSLSHQARKLLTTPTQREATPTPTHEQFAHANIGPVSIAGYRAPTPNLSAQESSRIRLQNADPYDFSLPYYYGGYYGGWGYYYAPFRTPYGVIQSSGSLPW